MSGPTRPDIPAATEAPPAASTCDHFYASHCYRGMYVRLCMTCHEPDWDDLERQQRESVDMRERAERAEAKLARIREEAAEWAELAPADDWGESVVDTFKADVGRALLRIIDGGKAAPFSATCTGPDCGERFTDSETGEYEFATQARMEKLLRADGRQVNPVLCPACQEEGSHG